MAAGDLAGLHAVVNAQGGTTTAPWLEDMGPGEILTVRGVDEWIVAIAADPCRSTWCGARGEGPLAVTEFVRLVLERA